MKNTTFVVNADTTGISDGGLAVTKDNAFADSIDRDTFVAKVTDANGNVVPGVDVTFICSAEL